MRSKKMYVVDSDYRMKIINFLKIYGSYGGILVNKDIWKRYVNGEVAINDIIQNKKDFKELKISISVVLEYCYDNHFREIEDIINHFYRVECLDLRKNYGSLFDKF